MALFYWKNLFFLLHWTPIRWRKTRRDNTKHVSKPSFGDFSRLFFAQCTQTMGGGHATPISLHKIEAASKLLRGSKKKPPPAHRRKFLPLTRVLKAQNYKETFCQKKQSRHLFLNIFLTLFMILKTDDVANFFFSPSPNPFWNANRCQVNFYDSLLAKCCSVSYRNVMVCRLFKDQLNSIMIRNDTGNSGFFPVPIL